MTSLRGGAVVSYCKFCHSEKSMKPVGDGFDGKIIWLRCVDCSKMIFLKREDYEGLLENKTGKANGHEEICEDYEPTKIFHVGQLLYHKVWDDKGEVMKKETTNSGQQAIIVAFDRLGERVLVENLHL